MLLPILIFIFIVVIMFIGYSNWPKAVPAVTAEQTCQSCGEPSKKCGCGRGLPPCGQCGMPKPQCGCPKKAACQFC